MKTIAALAILSCLVMGLAAAVIGAFASATNFLVGIQLYVFLAALFVAGTLILWGFFPWIAVACSLLAGFERGDND